MYIEHIHIPVSDLEMVPMASSFCIKDLNISFKGQNRSGSIFVKNPNQNKKNKKGKKRFKGLE